MWSCSLFSGWGASEIPEGSANLEAFPPGAHPFCSQVQALLRGTGTRKLEAQHCHTSRAPGVHSLLSCADAARSVAPAAPARAQAGLIPCCKWEAEAGRDQLLRPPVASPGLPWTCSQLPTCKGLTHGWMGQGAQQWQPLPYAQKPSSKNALDRNTPAISPAATSN